MPAIKLCVGVGHFETTIKNVVGTNHDLKIIRINGIEPEEDDYKISSILARSHYPTPRRIYHVTFKSPGRQVCLQMLCLSSGLVDCWCFSLNFQLKSVLDYASFGFLIHIPNI